MGAVQFTYAECVSKLRLNGGTAHNHVGGYKALNDFDRKAASYLVEENVIETVITMFLDAERTVPAFILGRFKSAPDGSVSGWLVDASPELTDDEALMSLLMTDFNTQITRIGKGKTGRVPANAKAYVMQRKARFPKHITNVIEAADTNVVHTVFRDKLLENGMGMVKRVGSAKKKKKQV